MSGTILYMSQSEPKWPATDQHPQAVRFQIGSRWVDAVGGQPTQAELDALDAQMAADQQAGRDQAEIANALLKVLFNHENRIRALESKAALTRAQFLTAVRNLATP